MNFRSAHLYLSGHCESSPWPPEPSVTKAVQAAEKQEELAFLLARQRALDLQAEGALKEIALPPELLAELSSRAEQPKKAGDWKRQIFQPAILAPVLSLLLICGIFLYLAMMKARNFPGFSAAQDMIDSAQNMAPSEMAPVSKTGAEMEDWFFLKYGLEGFGLPAPLRKSHIVGVRLLKQDGHPVAQMAAEPNLMLYVFRPDDFGIVLAGKSSQIFEQGAWVAAISRPGPMGLMLSFPGDTAEMHRFLQRHELETP